MVLPQASTYPVDGCEIVPLPRFQQITSATQAAAPPDLLVRDDVRPPAGCGGAPGGDTHGDFRLPVHAVEILGRVAKEESYDPVHAGPHPASRLAVFDQIVTMAAFGEDLIQLVTSGTREARTYQRRSSSRSDSMPSSIGSEAGPDA